MRAVSTVIDQPEDVEPVENVALVEFMYLVFTRMPGESYCRATQVFVVVFVLHISSAN